MALLLKDWL